MTAVRATCAPTPGPAARPPSSRSEPAASSRRARGTRAAAVALLLSLAGLFAVLAATPALAASAAATPSPSPTARTGLLVKSEPSFGQELGTAPASVTLDFSAKPTAAARVQVIGPKGSAAGGALQVVGKHLTQPLAPGLVNGTYLVSWQATSINGLALDGSLTFLVNNPSGAPISPPLPQAAASKIGLLTVSATATPIPGMNTKHLGAMGRIVGLVVLVAVVVLAGGVIASRR